MINRLDTYVDTKEKRRCAFGILVLFTMIVIWLPYVRQSMALISLSAYEDVFQLLRSSLVDQTYLSRLMVILIQCHRLNARFFIQALLSALHLGEVIAMLLWVILGMTRPMRRTFHWQLGCFGLWAAAIIVAIVTALQAETLMQAVQLLQRIGYVTLINFSIVLLMQCFALFHYLRAYRKALIVQVIEVSESTQGQEKTYGQ